jgi:lipoprotein-anchoring transpeptidase ErfK/SrfK
MKCFPVAKIHRAEPMSILQFHILPATAALLCILQLTACQTLRNPVMADVPAAIPAADLALIDKAIAESPNSLAVFNEKLAASPLDSIRSGVIVDLDRQRAYIYSQTSLVAATRIASGKKNYRTPTGDYKIGQKNPNHASNLYGKLRNSETGEDLPGEIDTRTTPVPEGMVFLGAPMPHFMRFHTLDGKASAIGFHQGHVPSRPASHGCIRLPSRSAKSLYKMLPSGTQVFIYGDQYGAPSRPLPETAEIPEAKRKKQKS